MKYILLIALLIPSSNVSADPTTDRVIQILEKLFHDPESRKVVEANLSLRKVIRIAFWNSRSGSISNTDLALMKTEIASDSGRVATALFERGFNYRVLVELRQVVEYDPHKVSYGVIDVSGIPEVPSGIPEFAQVDAKEWATSFTGILKVMYRKDIFWVMEQARAKVYQAVEAAGTVSHSPVNLFVNRYNQAKELLDFLDYVEATLTQYQSLLAVLEVRKARHPDKVRDFEKLENDVETHLAKLMEVLKSILAANTNQKKAWSEISKSLRSKKGQLPEMENDLARVTTATIDGIDKITGNTSQTDRYSNDEIPELILKLKEHKKALTKMSDRWEAGSVYKYHDRVHRWMYYHYHSEEHGPYLLQSSEQRSRDIPGFEIAPFIEEQKLVEYLKTTTAQLTEAKLQALQIQEIRERLLQKQKEHQTYIAEGPIYPQIMHPNQRVGFEARFKARNDNIAARLKFLINTS